MPVTLTNTRLSLIWAECFVGHTSVSPRPGKPALWIRERYGAQFRQLRVQTPDDWLGFPWREAKGNSFWREYFGGQAADSIAAETAWDYITPLRLLPDPAPIIHTDDPAERVYCDMFGFSMGLAGAITIQSARKPRSLDQWRDRLIQLRHNDFYTIDIGGKVTTGLDARRAAQLLGDHYRTIYYGNVGATVGGPDDLFTIATVIEGDGVNASVKPSSAIQAALNVVTSWPANISSAKAPPLDDAKLPLSRRVQAEGDVHYASRRGRAIWRPSLFGPAGAKLGNRPSHTVSCLHHNMAAVSVQAEMFRNFARGRATLGLGGISFSVEGNIAKVIDALRRAEGTYRSSSGTFFEGVIVDLLVAMGYGGAHERAALRLGKSGDGGVDGVLDEDRLGLDRPEIQAFGGSLVGIGATRGVFVTTSTFSSPAVQFVQHLPQRAILINGDRLAELTVEHNVGVRTSRTVAIKRLDEDFFVED